MKTFRLFSILGISLALAGACKEKEIADDGLIYEITAPESDSYSVEVQETAKAGQEIPVTVTLAEDAALKVTSVLFNDTPCELVSNDGLVYNFKFVMPATHVTLVVETSKTAFSINWERSSEDYQIACSTSSAEPGDEVKFTLSVVNLKYKVSLVTYGTSSETCQQDGDPEFVNNDAMVGPLQYIFKFTMPEKDVNIKVELEESLNRIWRTSVPHANIRMLNRLYPDGNNPDIDESIENEYDRKVCMGLFKESAYFVVDADPGYNYSNPVIKGRITGNSYNATFGNNDGYGESFTFSMPAEPLDITITATEEDEYKGKEFVGTYNAFWLKVRNESLIYSEDAPTMTYDLLMNKTYNISSTDENNFSGVGFYLFDESNNTFEYQYDDMKANLETQKTNAGLGGRYGSEISFVSVVNIAEPMPENTRYYIAAKGDALTDFISASSTSGNMLLMSFKYNGEQRYYWYDHNEGMSLTAVDVKFLSGSDLSSSDASALVKMDGQPFMKYSVADGKPVFTNKGAEAGTYTGSEGDLVLDGFGNATLNGNEGTYELDGTTLIFKDSSETETKLLIDVKEHTYSVVSDSAEWDGPMQFSVESPNGLVGGKAKKALVALYLSGYVHFQFAFDNYGRWEDEINTAISYVYDASAQTLTISFLNFAGNPTSIEQGNGAYPSLSQIVFKVSSDKKSLEFTGINTLYGRWNTNSLPLDGVVLQAVE